MQNIKRVYIHVANRNTHCKPSGIPNAHSHIKKKKSFLDYPDDDFLSRNMSL